jgi:hypothetical protein
MDDNSDSESNGDDLTGTRYDIEGVLDRAAAAWGTTATPLPLGPTHLCLFEGDDDTDSDDATSAFASGLPISPNAASSVPSSGFQDLVGVTAQTTPATAEETRRPSRLHDFRLLARRAAAIHQRRASNHDAEPSRSELLRDERPTEVIDLLENALENDREWSPPPPLPQDVAQPAPLRPYASINDVSRAFTLNQLQHVAFTIITTALLQRFMRQERAGQPGSGAGYRAGNFEEHLRNDQLMMFLGGAGGTGMSRVIDAVDAFCTSWHRDDAVVKTALTGKTATLIGGRTLASFAPLDLLVIDEISMMSKPE